MEKKPTPKWFIVTSIFMLVILWPLFLLALFLSPLSIYLVYPFVILEPIWISVNVVMTVYFLVKRYELLSLVLPTLHFFKILTLFPLLWLADNIASTSKSQFGIILWPLAIISFFTFLFALYLMMKEKPGEVATKVEHDRELRCKKCGATPSSDSKFCSDCGAKRK